MFNSIVTFNYRWFFFFFSLEEFDLRKMSSVRSFRKKKNQVLIFSAFLSEKEGEGRLVM